MNYDDHRRDYVLGGLRSEALSSNPLDLFSQWQQQAIAAGLKDPTAVVLATRETSGLLWQRIVLLKGVSEDGFVFFTNYDSNKAQALAADDRASLLFPWNELDRQVSVAGQVMKVSAQESDAYFSSRPRASQLGAWASRQSRSIENREALVAQYQDMEARHAEREIPRPPHWGGYRLVPEQVEFWQGGEHRLHDRFRYQRSGQGWTVTRLQP